MADVYKVETVREETSGSWGMIAVFALIVAIGLIFAAVIYSQQPRTATDTAPRINIQAPNPAPSPNPSIIPVPIPGPKGDPGPAGPAGTPGADAPAPAPADSGVGTTTP